jgi:hypothetical protein
MGLAWADLILKDLTPVALSVALSKPIFCAFWEFCSTAFTLKTQQACGGLGVLQGRLITSLQALMRLAGRQTLY